jgi:hypothetical protein
MNSPSSDIRFLNRGEIDPEKWDLCIQEASNGMIYARSFYLDTMAKNWSALISGDYDTVMPLTWNRKFGFTYLYQPAFTAQLGIFCRYQALPDLENFINEIKTHFLFAEIHLNFGNNSLDFPLRANYILSLGKSYLEIRKEYSDRMLEYLKKSAFNGLSYRPSEAYTSAMGIFKAHYGKRLRHLRKKDYRNFENLCRLLSERKMVFAREVRDKSDNLLCINIFFQDEKRIYNIMPVTLPSGKDLRAQFYLIDMLIKEFAMQNMILDFEGSEIPGIAAFYMKFGSVNQPYPFLRFNRLPFPFHYFK